RATRPAGRRARSRDLAQARAREPRDRAAPAALAARPGEHELRGDQADHRLADRHREEQVASSAHGPARTLPRPATGDPMTADEARGLFSAALDQELDEQQTPAFAAALAKDAELAREYEAFVATFTQAQVEAATAPVPDLLPAVQRRLRARSRGRF